MNIKRMKKAELIELNEQLNEAREHTDAVVAQLRAELEAARAEIAALRERVAEPAAPMGTAPEQAQRVSHSAPRVVSRNAKLVHEFDPSVPGSYLDAMRRCRELGGTVRRAQQ